MIYLTENGSDIMSQTEGKYLESLRKRYAKARKKERGQILDEYVQTTGYHRKYAILVLSRKRVRKTQPATASPRQRLHGGRCAGVGKSERPV